MIRTKSIYDPPSRDDGVRVLVTRYWPRGVKKEKSALWFKDLGPSPELIKRWKSGSIPWKEFEKKYLAEYADENKKAVLEELRTEIKKTRRANVTLLCTCKETEPCHRKILRGILEEGLP